ncbi:unnamed protein product, partial [Mesorhabditis belari]|uniref:Uncharacterized protein n=1 Tax=Mesorhabditis belari TaxID=2138241 RepID=A0AAF3FAM2_9BILA
MKNGLKSATARAKTFKFIRLVATGETLRAMRRLINIFGSNERSRALLIQTISRLFESTTRWIYRQTQKLSLVDPGVNGCTKVKSFSMLDATQAHGQIGSKSPKKRKEFEIGWASITELERIKRIGHGAAPINTDNIIRKQVAVVPADYVNAIWEGEAFSEDNYYMRTG